MKNISFGILATVVLIAMGLYLGFCGQDPVSFTEHEVQQMVISTITADSDTSVFITGYLDLLTEIRLEDTKKVWPGLSLGTNEVDLRAPGKAAYGFSLSDFSVENIRYAGNDTVDVFLPPLGIFLVEPDLENMDIKTDMGWARFYSRSGRRMEHTALRMLPAKMREAAVQRLRTSDEPYEHTWTSVVSLLTPVFKTAGLKNPVVRVYHLEAANGSQFDR